MALNVSVVHKNRLICYCFWWFVEVFISCLFWCIYAIYFNVNENKKWSNTNNFIVNKLEFMGIACFWVIQISIGKRWFQLMHFIHLFKEASAHFERLVCLINVSKIFFVYYECLKDVFCMLWMSQRRLLYVMNVSKMSFVCY